MNVCLVHSYYFKTLIQLQNTIINFDPNVSIFNANTKSTHFKSSNISIVNNFNFNDDSFQFLYDIVMPTQFIKVDKNENLIYQPKIILIFTLFNNISITTKFIFDHLFIIPVNNIIDCSNFLVNASTRYNDIDRLYSLQKHSFSFSFSDFYKL